jgi:hypothetical protein
MSVCTPRVGFAAVRLEAIAKEAAGDRKRIVKCLDAYMPIEVY